MEWAVNRLLQAGDRQEKVAIWGDFDADGITATSVLWDGLGALFPQHERLFYWIPNRLIESHGLSQRGIEYLAEQGVHLIVTCDTGSTNPHEIDAAKRLGMDVIVTDHHTLPKERPNVVAIVNPRQLDRTHPLASLSGVAVAYKLVEALYERWPGVDPSNLTRLLDLVAIGLIADLVELVGDCRYLAQVGIEQLQRNQTQIPPPRPGVANLLDLCKRTGDRPTDISFGLGPRINAISRIHGDARFCVELLTSHDADRCRQLAQETELANARRRSLQEDVVKEVKARVEALDLSTTQVIVLVDEQWPVGILGLVAGRIAQEYGRPTVLLTTDTLSQQQEQAEEGEKQETPLTNFPLDNFSNRSQPIARGSARSVHQIDLYDLLNSQQHLLCGFGGHPFAAGLSISVANLPLFIEGINRQFREQYDGDRLTPVLHADLTVTVADLGKDLFRALKLLEPCGIGNPTPRLLLQNVWFEQVSSSKTKDWRGKKLNYSLVKFCLRDNSCDRSFPGVWWGHTKSDIPASRCDVVVELDVDSYRKIYIARLIDLRSTQGDRPMPALSVDWIVDQRQQAIPLEADPNTLVLTRCPRHWSELNTWFRRAYQARSSLVLAYCAPDPIPPLDRWTQLVGIAKYLSRTEQVATRLQLLERLQMGDRPLYFGIQSLQQLGFQVTSSDQGLHIQAGTAFNSPQPESTLQNAIQAFCQALQEEQFQQQYFAQVPLSTLQSAAYQLLLGMVI
jgi:single-stranded-DNA-specific exonuclease